jgi:transcriptional regulator with XRE-family HTH domain
MTPTQRRRPESIPVDRAKLTEARRKLGLTQVELADLAGISQSYLSALELGERPRVRPARYRRLCDALGLHPDALVQL